LTKASEVSQGEQMTVGQATEKPEIMGPISLVEVTGEDSNVRVRPSRRTKQRPVKKDHRRSRRPKIR